MRGSLPALKANESILRNATNSLLTVAGAAPSSSLFR
jgi:hypothetical protein